MPKAHKTTPTATPTASSTDASLLSLDSLNALPAAERVALYVTTENRQRIGFLLQGKILYSLGTEGMEQLRAAGIKPSSLHNARKAEWVIATFSNTDPKSAVKNVLIHNGTDAVAFSEELYNTFTPRQCELLRIAFTSIGTHRYRPTPQQATEIVASPGWEEDLESFLDTGLTVAGMDAKRIADAEALEAERLRIANMERQIAEQQERDRAAAAALAAAPPPLPVPIATASLPPPATATETPTNVVPFTSENQSDASRAPARQTAEGSPQGGDGNRSINTPARNSETEAEASPPTPEAPHSDAAPDDEPIATDTPTAHEEDDTAIDDDITDDDDETADSLTPAEIGQAVHDATAGIHEFTGANASEHIANAINDLETDFDTNIAGLDLGELHDLEARLQRLLEATRHTITSKAEPQDDIPANATPTKKSRTRKTAQAAA